MSSNPIVQDPAPHLHMLWEVPYLVMLATKWTSSPATRLSPSGDQTTSSQYLLRREENATFDLEGFFL
jgi:hypothetical protein